jgi:hypothetical protein
MLLPVADFIQLHTGRAEASGTASPVPLHNGKCYKTNIFNRKKDQKDTPSITLNVGRLGIFRFIVFVMNLDKIYKFERVKIIYFGMEGVVFRFNVQYV